MIISFSSSVPSREIVFSVEDTDVFTFFSSENSIFMPEEKWVHAVAASLKLKRNVLVLESYREEVPALDMTARWQAGEDFLRIAPRGLSVLLEASHEFSGSYGLVKSFFINSK